MAAAEIRAIWHRSANHCFVQEDTKITPKLACATSKLADHVAINVTHFSRKSSFPNLGPDSRWWLMQPNQGFQKGLTYDQFNVVVDEVGILRASDENEAHEGYYKQFGDANHYSSHDIQHHFQADITEKAKNDRMQEAYGENSQVFHAIIDMMAKHETLEIDSVGLLVSKQINCFSLDSDCSWIEDDKAKPWWRTSDRDELASFVSQKSVNHIENCDLPPPQKNEIIFLEGVTEQVFIKAQLIEALCHSQTRAREAEELAKQVYAEKEHLIELFFKQASQLFAYKQWFRLLQLETIHIHIKNKDHPIHTLHKFANTKQERQTKPKGGVTTTYAVAFALGMGLVGAGLLLGWSVGRMLPRL
ncbi:hypothetical protein TanjilG_18069 [Lupinus angustifolius]|uniref:Uncharacterized protein n=1 Tax=Lupinus angustifolius TaxID=3871 RepID=A0A1J7GVJ2_LUPAN|nr:hypothetical protein TanjilG_18069 [Lupinus angustifolius]